MGGSLDLTIAVSRLPPGLMLTLGRKFQSLLTIHNHPTLMARRWTGQWDQAAITALRSDIANCTRKQLQTVLGHIGRVTSASSTASWREFMALARELSPPTYDHSVTLPLVDGQQSTIDWDPRLGEDHG